MSLPRTPSCAVREAVAAVLLAAWTRRAPSVSAATVGTRTRASTRHRIRQFRRYQRVEVRLGRLTPLGPACRGAPSAVSTGTMLPLSLPTIPGGPLLPIRGTRRTGEEDGGNYMGIDANS